MISRIRGQDIFRGNRPPASGPNAAIAIAYLPKAAEGRLVRTISSIGAIVLVLAGAPALAQVTGQPILLDPHPAVSNPQLDPAKPRAAPPAPQAVPAKAQTAPAKPPRAAAKPPSTPESRSAAALALSADPVFDEGTYQRIKEARLS